MKLYCQGPEDPTENKYFFLEEGMLRKKTEFKTLIPSQQCL